MIKIYYVNGRYNHTMSYNQTWSEYVRNNTFIEHTLVTYER